MVAKICLFTCVLSIGQTVDRKMWLLTPQLERGQEFVYSGSYEEKSLIPGVVLERSYRLQLRAFVVDATQNGWNVAFWTSLQQRSGASNASPAQPKPSVRLELAGIDKQGRISQRDGSLLSVPLEGPPTLEHGCIVAAPLTRVSRAESWFVAEPGRPPLIWKVIGKAVVGNTKCLKLEGVQESAEWKDPRSASAAWKRVEHVWMIPQGGIVLRLERKIQHRDAARKSPTHVSVTRYELDRQWTYPEGPILNARRENILQSVKFINKVEQYLPDHLKYKNQLDVLVKQIGIYVHHQKPFTPYRQVLEQTQRRILAVQRGEIVLKKNEAQKPLIPVARVGSRAPDFLVTDLISKRSVRMHQFLGRPVVMVFYNPLTRTGHHALKFAKKISDKYKTEVNVLALAVAYDTSMVPRQCREMELTFPVLDGMGLHRTFAVDATPRMIVIDSKGVVRGAYTGWGAHIPQLIQTDLKGALPKN